MSPVQTESVWTSSQPRQTTPTKESWQKVGNYPIAASGEAVRIDANDP